MVDLYGRCVRMRESVLQRPFCEDHKDTFVRFYSRTSAVAWTRRSPFHPFLIFFSGFGVVVFLSRHFIDCASQMQASLSTTWHYRAGAGFGKIATTSSVLLGLVVVKSCFLDSVKREYGIVSIAPRNCYSIVTTFHDALRYYRIYHKLYGGWPRREKN